MAAGQARVSQLACPRIEWKSIPIQAAQQATGEGANRHLLSYATAVYNRTRQYCTLANHTLTTEALMNTETTLSNALLWATAIIGSAIVGAPQVLTLIILPSLAAFSFLHGVVRTPKRNCRPLSGAA